MNPYEPRPLDVLNTENHPEWNEVLEQIVRWRIQSNQRALGLTCWRHTHTMVYFGKIPELDRAEATSVGITLSRWDELREHSDWVFSVTWPEATWVQWQDVRNQDWDAYRYRRTLFSDWDVEVGRREAWRHIGSDYDWTQLLGIAAHRWLGIARSKPLRILNRRFEKVCSTGGRRVFEAIRQDRFGSGREPMPRLFVKDGVRLHPSKTTPGHFASWPEDFEHVGSARHG